MKKKLLCCCNIYKEIWFLIGEYFEYFCKRGFMYLLGMDDVFSKERNVFYVDVIELILGNCFLCK